MAVFGLSLWCSVLMPFDLLPSPASPGLTCLGDAFIISSAAASLLDCVEPSHNKCLYEGWSAERWKRLPAPSEPDLACLELLLPQNGLQVSITNPDGFDLSLLSRASARLHQHVASEISFSSFSRWCSFTVSTNGQKLACVKIYVDETDNEKLEFYC